MAIETESGFLYNRVNDDLYANVFASSIVAIIAIFVVFVVFVIVAIIVIVDIIAIFVIVAIDSDTSDDRFRNGLDIALLWMKTVTGCISCYFYPSTAGFLTKSSLSSDDRAAVSNYFPNARAYTRVRACARVRFLLFFVSIVASVAKKKINTIIKTLKSQFLFLFLPADQEARHDSLQST